MSLLFIDLGLEMKSHALASLSKASHKQLFFFFELKWWVDTPQHFIHKQLLRLPKGIYMLKDWFSQLLTPVPNMCIMDGIPNFLHIINQVF